jgi:hypothetical protein
MEGKFYKCDCGHGGLYVQYDNDYGLEVSHFQYDVSRSFWNRIKFAWKCLTGKPYCDMVLLSDSKIADLVDQLIHVQNTDLKKEDYDQTVQSTADKLCGLSCGTAIDAILAYTARPDCSKKQITRLIDTLTKYYKK